MKLNVLLLGILGRLGKVYANVLRDCNTNDLKNTTNFDKWECIPSSASGYEPISLLENENKFDFSYVSDGTTCALVCKENYIPFYLGLRKHHECVHGEWKDPESADMECQLNSELKLENFSYSRVSTLTKLIF